MNNITRLLIKLIVELKSMIKILRSEFTNVKKIYISIFGIDGTIC